MKAMGLEGVPMSALNERRTGRGWRVGSLLAATPRLAAVALLLAGCDECVSDADCEDGQVCEAVSRSAGSGSQNQCVSGCHEDSQCGAGERCEQVVCVTTPCPGQCVASADECADDSDCTAGSVCELSTGCTSPSTCVAGCRADAECADGLHCLQPQCFTCPCPGFCSE
jgi:hypothetical protein